MTTTSITIQESASPLWLKIIAGVGIVWYAFGVLQFWLGYSMDLEAAVSAGTMTPAHAAAIDGTPGLIWLSFAVASAAGLIGSALLFGRSAASSIVFGVSLISAGIYYAWIYGLSGTGADRPSEELIIACVVGTVTAVFFLLSRRVT